MIRDVPQASAKPAIAVYDPRWFTPAGQRSAAIAHALSGQEPGSHPVALAGFYRDCPVVRLSHSDLAYRFDNGRLIAERAQAFAAAGLAAGAADGESAEEQAVLHELLSAHANDPRGPILAELARAGRQVEPLIATAEGVVVNGNRRLAAMRALNEAKDGDEAPFARVDIAILPPGIETAELEYLEASLQMAPETKLGYGWPNRRMKLRTQRDVLKLPAGRMIEAYRLEGEAQLEREIGELALAERYLAWLGKPGAWGELEGGWPLVEALAAQLPALDEPMRAIWRAIGFLLIRHRQGGDPGKVFPFAAPFSPQHPRLAAQRIAGLAGLLEAAAPGDKVLEAALVPFADTGDAARAAEIGEVMAALRQEHRERVAPMRALSQLRQTGAMLQRLEPERLSQAQRRQLRSDLAALTAQASYLLGEIEETREDRRASWNRRKGLFDPPFRKILPRMLRRLSRAKD
ncbi:hypothetical protein [Aureimonas populi]|uniref:ParB/Sulfiredoxin domain-containing protein n=1 Tax=Aureimonas populi TaxID=1701758 RepID=A0ABW5CL12_9HYPH|nr:hypothetical protein [Aureimonas populi]